MRSGNVVIRPAVRDYEITAGVPPGRPPDRTIPLNELVVCVREGRFCLRWATRGTDVVVRAGHMLTNFHAPEVCRFLDDLAQDGIAQLAGFDWGPAFAYPFLPRLESGRIVISPARWRISAALRDAELPSDGGFPEKLARFRERRGLPRHVYLTTGDNRLLLDLEAPDQANELRTELARIGKQGAVLLQEALPGPQHAWLEGLDGRHLAELVVPLVLRPRIADTSAHMSATIDRIPPIAKQPISAFTRARPPGSDWLFEKLYCPLQLEEELLAGPIREFCHEISRTRMADGWFFIRYSDPDPHVRLRFRGDPNRLLSGLMPELCSWSADLMADGRCQRFAFDTYDREIERYGGAAGMAAAEAIFTADSPATVDLLALIRSTPELDRLTLAVVSIDDMLDSLGLDENERLAWYRSWTTSRRMSGADFRELKSKLRPLLGSCSELGLLPRGTDFSRILAERRRALASIVGRISELERRNELGKPRLTILHSIVHMHCNRLAGSDRSIEERALGLLLRMRESLKQAPLPG